MKKAHILSILFITFLTLSIPIEARHRYRQISITELPSEGRSLLKNCFNKHEVYYVKQDNHGYDVYLDNNIKIELDYHGNWKQIKANDHGTLPQSVQKLLPKNASSYINRNFSEWRIIKMKRKDYGYKIKLDNGRHDAQLKVNHHGDLLKVDY